MDITQQKLKLSCNTCKKNFICTFNTTQCPHCNADFDSDVIHRIFYDYETRLENNNLYKTGEKMEKFGSGMQQAGSGLSQLGCGCMMIPFAIVGIIIIISLFS